MNQLQGLLLFYTAIILFSLFFNAALWIKTSVVHYKLACLACVAMVGTIVLQNIVATADYFYRDLAASTTFLGLLTFTRLLTVMLGTPFRWKFFSVVYFSGALISVFLFLVGADTNLTGIPILLGASFPMLWEGSRALIFKRKSMSFIITFFVLTALIYSLHMVDYSYAVNRPELQPLGFTIAVIAIFGLTTFGTAAALEAVTGEFTRHRMEVEFRARLLNSEKLASLGEMAGGVAHEINNPLTVIQLYSEKLKIELEKEEIDRNVLLKDTNIISATVNRIAKIVLGLRSFARDASRDPFVEVSFLEIVNSTLTFCEERFKERGVAIEKETPSDVKIWCRPVEISQALLNILNNSFDSVLTTNGQKWIKITLRKEPQFAFLTVSDSGPLISAQLRDKIFEPFFTTKGIGSAGLGLSVSLGIIQSEGGSLELDSAAPYNRFIIKVPTYPNVNA